MKYLQNGMMMMMGQGYKVVCLSDCLTARRIKRKETKTAIAERESVNDEEEMTSQISVIKLFFFFGTAYVRTRVCIFAKCV